MEVALRRNSFSTKLLFIVMLIVCLAILIPSSIALAQAVASQKTVQMSGVNDSDLMVGMSGIASSSLLINYGAGTHFNPHEPVFQIVMLFPIIFIAMALYLILSMFAKGEFDFRIIITVAVIIYVSIILLQSMQVQITDLLGG